MRISIFGLGYVGTVSAACLAKEGHDIIGVDVENTKVDIVNNGMTPIIEKDIGEIIKDVVSNDKLRATTDTDEAILNTDISVICVGTPSQLNGNLDLKYIRRVSENIGRALSKKEQRHLVVVRSTILPGTMRTVIIPTIEETSGKRAVQDFDICYNPEFLREGTAVFDFYNPPKTVIGEIDGTQSGDLLAEIYAGLDAPLIRTSIELSEMVKYVDNIWHGLKVAFGNEIGNICKALGIDGHQLMDIFCADTKLNISGKYLKPGFAFGGSCLPKDLRAFTYKARTLDLNLPILNSIIPSNELQVEKGLRMIMEKNNRKIGILGFSFKAGTDDLRESPMVEIIERLLGKGYDLYLYDRNVRLASLVGANRDYILNRIPHIAKLMIENVDDVLDNAETIVFGNNEPEFKSALKRIRKDQVVVDLARVHPGLAASTGNYDGICW
jgi:GDP-mannose 6-dehydrogenase